MRFQIFSVILLSLVATRLVRVLLLLVLALVALCVAVGHLVADEVVERDDGADERGEVDDQHLVVGLDVHRLDERQEVDVWQQIEHVLQKVDNLVVDRQFP